MFILVLAGSTTTAVFGQPLTAVIDNEKIRGTMCSPTNPSPPAVFPNNNNTNVSLSLTIQTHPVSISVGHHRCIGDDYTHSFTCSTIFNH